MFLGGVSGKKTETGATDYRTIKMAALDSTNFVTKHKQNLNQSQVLSIDEVRLELEVVDI